MYRKIVWCYLIVLTLLDLSLNTKLSAQGKSHGNGKIDFENGASVHESLIEEISLQEWGKEPAEGRGGGAGGGRAVPEGVLQLSPAALDFGHAALAAPHALLVTITNTANETIHLASVAGTTPDFHASFFDSKTLAPQANTSFTVVYLGRREGPVSTHLYVHTSKGSVRYAVCAVGVASAWRVWPLVGVRVPGNASLEALLTLYNPTESAVQVSEVAASGGWLTLALPAGGAATDAAKWLVPPRAARALVALQVRAPPALAPAYLRIKGNMTGGPLVVCVEALPAPPGEHLAPLHLRLAARGSRDPPDTRTLHAASSGAEPRRLRAALHAAGCSTRAAPPLHLPPPYEDDDYVAQNGDGVGDGGVHVSLLRDHLDPYQELTETAKVTFDYGAMWAAAGGGTGNGAANGASNGESNGGADEHGAADGAWCGGWVRVGRAALPYSVRVLPGTVRLDPPQLHFVTSEGEAGLQPQEVVAHNEFKVPVRVTHVDIPDEVERYFHTESWAPLELGAGGAASVVRLSARPHAVHHQLRAELRVHTNVTEYALPLLLYTATLSFEWEWGAWSADELELGVVGAGGAVVAGRLRNPGPAPLCATLHAKLPHATATLRYTSCAEECCVEAGGWAGVELAVREVVAAGALAGAVWARCPRAATRVRLRLTPAHGDLVAPPVLLPPAAPYVWATAPLVVESTMAERMRLVDVTQPPGRADPALSFRPGAEREPEVVPGRTVLGAVVYAPEAHCQPACDTGLDPLSAEGAAWLARGGSAALAADAAMARERRGRFAARELNATLVVRTTRVLGLRAAVRARRAWPALLAAPPPAARQVPVGGDAPRVLRLRNPSQRPLLLHPLLDTGFHPTGEADEAPGCAWCTWSADAFALGEWRATRGAAAPAPGAPRYLLLEPLAQLELTVTFAPPQPVELAAYLYLRNNLTILERVVLTGRGAHPSFELAGRKPNSSSPILLEVAECAVGDGAGLVRRTLTLRNTGGVALRLRDWRVGGAPCSGRGFSVQPCAPLALAPNDSRTLTVSFGADWTRARAAAALSVRAGARTAHWQLHAVAPARLLRYCEPQARRPPFEALLHALGTALALLTLAGAAALAAVDAERALRRARAARPAQESGGAPLDLRALSRPEPVPAAAPVARRRRTPRRRAGALDPAAERRAFDRWRADVERRAAPAARDDSPSPSPSEEEPERAAPPPSPPHDHSSSTSSSPDSSPPPTDRSSHRRGSFGPGPERDLIGSPDRRGYSPCDREADEEGASTGSESSSSAGDRSEGSSGRAPASPAPPAAPREPPSPPPAAPARARAARDAARGARAGARRERAARRRERAPSPPRPAPRASPRAPPAVRWGASWSSVVSRGGAPTTPPATPDAPALAPIGSDVRRRLGSHSLFYYGAGAAAGTGAWPPPSEPAPAPAPADTEWGAEERGVWGGGGAEPAAWLWGGPAPVRPPPGFPPARAVRPFDPFHSLASIWTPAALDWRADAAPEDKPDAPRPRSPA